MASARKMMRQVPPKEAPRWVDGTPAVQPAQTLVLNQAAFFEVPGAFLGWMRWGSWGQP
jgi:hypothetical protein